MRKLTLVLTIIVATNFSLRAQNPLAIPDTLSGDSIELTLQEGKVPFFAGDCTMTYGANGPMLGPTLILNKGQFVDIKIHNTLSESTTIHWHGMHVSSENDGGPHTVIEAGTTWNPSFTVMDHAATYWYHPHLHEKTNEHVLKGIAGFVIVRDNEEAALELPRTYGVDDFPLAIQTKAFDSLNPNQISITSALDSNIIINGTLDPYLDAPAQMVRFRLLNGSSERVYRFGFEDGRMFHQIGSDGGLLKSPFQTNRLMVAPGERAEILVDLSNDQGTTVKLMSYGSELGSGYYGSNAMGNVIVGYYDNPLNGNDFTVLPINVGAPTANPITTKPQVLTWEDPLVHYFGDPERDLTFGVASGGNGVTGPFGFVDRGLFYMNRIDDTVTLGTREIWNLANGTMIAHPFHIHDVQFYILTKNGSTAFPANEKGRKDVILVPPMGTVSFIAEFMDFANDSVPYMYHCHMLTHEDGGMMGQFIVVEDPNTGIDKKKAVKNALFEMYPNPSNGLIEVNLQNAGTSAIEVFDLYGKVVYTDIVNTQNNRLDLSNLSKGVYLLKVQQSGETKISRLVLE